MIRRRTRARLGFFGELLVFPLRLYQWRRVPLAVLGGIIGFLVIPRTEAVQRSFSIGTSIGRIGYRLWYGVLRPLPDAE